MLRTRRTLAALVGTAVVSLVGVPLACTASAADGTPSPAASAPATVTFGIGPASAQALDDRPDFSLLQARGASTSDHVGLINLSSVPLTVSVYVVDAVTGADGMVSLKPRTDQQSDLASWVTLSTPGGKDTVTIPPRGRVILPFSVTVPTNAPVGDHLAGIVASVTAANQQAGAPNLALEQRVGVRLNMRVAGQMEPQLAVEGLTASYAGTLNPFGRGSVIVHYTVRNAGNVKLGGRQEVSLRGLLGSNRSATDLQDIPLLMPGASVDVTTVIPDVLPAVSMSADVQVVAAAPGTDANPDVAPATASTHLWLIPWSLLALILLIVVAVLALRRQRRTPPRSRGQHSRGPRDPLSSPPAGPVLVPGGHQ